MIHQNQIILFYNLCAQGTIIYLHDGRDLVSHPGSINKYQIPDVPAGKYTGYLLIIAPYQQT